jgi:acyl-CoA thioesterase
VSAVSELEEALALRPGDGCWHVFADPRYESVNAMFGGWTAAVLLRAVTSSADGHTAPSAITTNFIRPIAPGSAVRIRTRHLGGSRSVGHWVAELGPGSAGSTGDDADEVFALATVVLGTRRDTDGHTQPAMPPAPDPESLEEFHPPGPQGQRALIRPIDGTPSFGRMDTRSTSWVRETTGREVDRLQLAFLADQFAPRPFFWSEGPRPSATLTMTTYFHATDEEVGAVGDDYVLSEATGSRGAQSTSGQHARLWSRTGVLLATSEQLCWYR